MNKNVTEIIEYENLSKANKLFEKDFDLFFRQFLTKGRYILGDEVALFEKEFASWVGTKYCVGVASGLDALILSIKCLNPDKDAEIIVPSNTYIATILSIVHCGFKPVLVEPNIKTYNIDPKKIEEKITKNTAAIMVVHLYGKSCAMDEIKLIAEKHQIIIIEDCAQSHGASYKNKVTGTWGELSAFSFYPTKNLGALGDGGAILTDNEEFYCKLKMLRNYGSNKKYYNEISGINSRLDEFQAGILRIKLRKLHEINQHKVKLAAVYSKYIPDNYIKPNIHVDYKDVYHIYNIRHSLRNKLKSYLEENKIVTEIHYPLAPARQNAMKKILSGDYPLSDEIHATTLSLPISYFHTEKDILKVIEVLSKFDK